MKSRGFVPKAQLAHIRHCYGGAFVPAVQAARIRKYQYELDCGLLSINDVRRIEGLPVIEVTHDQIQELLK